MASLLKVGLLRKNGHRICVRHSLIVLGFEVNRAEVIERAMEALAVIESFDEVEDCQASLGSGFKTAAINELQLERAPEGFHGGVVVAAGFAAHRRQGLGLRQRVAVIGTGVLAAAVGMKHQFWWRLAMSLSHVPGREDQLGVNVLLHGPADDPTAIEVHNASQVEPAFVGMDVGDVADPDLVEGSGRGQLGQAIGSNGLVVVAVSGLDAEPALDASTEALLTH